MTLLLFRAEKEKIHYIVCDISTGSLTIGEKGTLSLEPASSPGEKYQLIMTALSKLQKKVASDKFVYRSGQGFRGNIDEIRYANEALLTYFAYSNKIEIEELTQPGVRKKLGLKNPEFKTSVEKELCTLIETNEFAKSDKILESLVFVSLLSHLN